MGRGKEWRPKEPDNLADSYVFASTNSVTGTGQKSYVFWNTIKERWDFLSPEEYEPGTFKDRTASNLKNFWNDHLHPQVNKFQQVLTKVLATQFTGNLTEDQKINIAVAYYTGATNKIHYDFRDFDSKEHWKCFTAWYNILRHQPKWSRELSQPPQPPINTAIALLGQRVAAAGQYLDGSVSAGTTGPDSSSSGEEDPVDPVAASAKKRGGFLGRGKGKDALKKSKKEEQKAKSDEQVQAYMKEMVTIAKAQADNSIELKNILS